MKRFCIDDETVMDYLEGRLTRRVRNQVEKHLCDCAQCRELVLTGAELLYDDEQHPVDPVSSAVTQRAIEAIKTVSKTRPDLKMQIVEGGRQLLAKGRSFFSAMGPGLVAQPAALRGGGEESADDGIREYISLSDADLVIEIEKTSATQFSIEIGRTSDKPLATPIQVGLFTDTNEIASATLLDDAVQFEDIPTGRYTIRFSKAGRRLDDYTFEM